MYSGTQDGNYSREGISRSFEAKLIETNKEASSEQLDQEEDDSGNNTANNLTEHHKY